MRRHLRWISIVGSLTAILGIVVIISACAQTPDGADEVSDASFLDQLLPGKVLHIKSERYKRYDPTADNSLSDECYNPHERSYSESWEQIAQDGLVYDKRVEAKDTKGDPYISYRIIDGVMVLTFANCSKEERIPTIPPYSLKEWASNRIGGYIDGLLDEGYERVGEGVWDDRETVIFEKPYRLVRYELVMDNLLISRYREWAMDAEGNRTLTEERVTTLLEVLDQAPTPMVVIPPTPTNTPLPPQIGPAPTGTPMPMGSMYGAITTIVDGIEQPGIDTKVMLVGPGTSRATTTPDGRYVFEQVPAGRHTVNVSNSYGFNDSVFDCFTVNIPENDAIEFDIVVYVSSIQVRRLHGFVGWDEDYPGYEADPPISYSVYAARMIEDGAPVVVPTPLGDAVTAAKARVSGLVTTIVDGKEEQMVNNLVRLWLRAQSGIEWLGGYEVYTRPNGEYVIEEVPGGDYALYISNSYPSNHNFLSDCLKVHVPEAGDIELDILVTMTSPVAGSDGEYEMYAEIREN